MDILQAIGIAGDLTINALRDDVRLSPIIAVKLVLIL